MNITEQNSRPTRFIHLHIPRSGGSHLQSILTGSFVRGNVISVDPSDFNARQPAEKDQPACFSGHMYFDMPGINPDEDQYLIVLREPMARLKSMFAYVSQRPTHKLHPLASPERAHELVGQPQFVNMATRLIAGQDREGNQPLDATALRKAKDHLQQDNVTLGVLENWEDYLHLLQNQFEMALKIDGNANSSARLEPELEHAWIGISAALAEANDYDRELYEFAKHCTTREAVSSVST